MHWLPEHAPTSAKYQFTEHGLLTARDPSGRENFFWSYTYMLYMFSKSKAIFNKKRALRHRKICQKMTYVWVWMHWLEEHGPKSGNYWFTKFIWLTVRDHRKGAKIILKLLFLSRRQVLIRKQRALSNKENLRKLVVFYSGCTDW